MTKEDAKKEIKKIDDKINEAKETAFAEGVATGKKAGYLNGVNAQNKIIFAMIKDNINVVDYLQNVT